MPRSSFVLFSISMIIDDGTGILYLALDPDRPSLNIAANSSSQSIENASNDATCRCSMRVLAEWDSSKWRITYPVKQCGRCDSRINDEPIQWCHRRDQQRIGSTFNMQVRGWIRVTQWCMFLFSIGGRETFSQPSRPYRDQTPEWNPVQSNPIPLAAPVEKPYNHPQATQSNAYESSLAPHQAVNDPYIPGSYHSQVSSIRAPIPTASSHSSLASTVHSDGMDNFLRRNRHAEPILCRFG